MNDALGFLVTNSLWLTSGAGAARAFGRALKEPRKAQEALLFSLLRQNAATIYGHRHGFSRLRSVRDYQDAVPIVTYDDIEPEIDDVKRGIQGVLTEEPVLMLEKTSGSAAAAKYIPYTASLRRQFQIALAAWIADLYIHRPRMLYGGAYWSVSPLAREREVTAGGLAVGFDDDTEYLGAVERWLLGRILLTPPALAQIPEISASRYVTLRFLLETPELGFISVWNPSFLSLLVRFLWDHTERLIEDIRGGTLNPPNPLPRHLQELFSRQLRARAQRADELDAIVKHHGKLFPTAVWPKLSVISCWAGASATLFVPELKSFFPEVEIQPKGLLATEGVVSIPLTGYGGAALAVASHFLEFLDVESPGARPLLADQLETGKNYSVVMTTGGGLYRYRLGDSIEVIGRVHQTPLVEFTGKEDLVSDLCGEKLHEASVREILNEIFRDFQLQPSFAMIAPEWGEPPAYVLFLEALLDSDGTLETLARRLEAKLIDNPHYAYCRRLGQLGAVRVARLRNAATELYLERCAALGQRRGNTKPTFLHGRTGWSEWFGVASLQQAGRETG